MSADLDREIDRAVRAMLDAEPPAAFRARVHSRIEDASAPVGSAFVASAFVASAFVASAFRRKLLFIATPIAVAVTILIAILLPSRQRVAPPAPSAPPSMAQANPTRTPLAPVTVPASDRHSSRTTPPPDRRARREEQRIAAAVDATTASAEAPGVPRLPALTIPDLNVPVIRTMPAAAPPAQLGVAAIAEPAPITFDPLPLSPRERPYQE